MALAELDSQLSSDGSPSFEKKGMERTSAPLVQTYRLDDLIHHVVPLPDFVEQSLDDLDPFLIGELSDGEVEAGQITENTVQIGSTIFDVAEASLQHAVVVSKYDQQAEDGEEGFVALVFTGKEVGRVIVNTQPDSDGHQIKTHINVGPGLVVVASTDAYIEVVPGKAMAFDLEGEEPPPLSFRFLSNTRRLSDSKPVTDRRSLVKAAA